MEVEEVKRLIAGGEKIDVELKKSTRELNRDIYDSVCAFTNRDGGDIFLGVNDDRTVIGVEPSAVDKMLKNFTTAINSGDKIYPPLFIIPKVIQIDGKIVIHIHVPKGSQVCRHAGKIFDRSYEGYMDITNNSEQVFKLYQRRQATFFVNKAYPHFDFSALDSAVIDKARRMTPYYNNIAHPWRNMTDEELLRSAGLILSDSETGREGLTLAAILLFGKDSTIMSVLPQYKTDAICRVYNLDRYDDRDVVITNLIDSYSRLMAFGQKHLNDIFVLDGIQRVSARDHILREMISNTLAHRDYSSALSAQFVIERDRMYTTNSNLANGHGVLNPKTFKPFSKNPPIAKVFREILLADELGSGMRNSYKYASLYSGGEPQFTEEDVFTLTVPLTEQANPLVNAPMVAETGEGSQKIEGNSQKTRETREKTEISSQETEKSSQKSSQKIMDLIRENNKVTTQEMADTLDISRRAVAKQIAHLQQKGFIRRVGPDKGGHWEITG